MQKKSRLQAAARAAYILLIAAMLFLFFTTDFGLVDIHKTSIVVAVGIDVTEEGYDVTAQAAIPTPAQGGGSATYTQVTGSGATVAEAVADINAKTGFYPKLVFCNLVVLGESCGQRDLLTVLDYFYRNDYVPLTALVAMCGGSAQELLGQKPADGGMSSSAIQRAMSVELKNSAIASTVNLKLLAQDAGSPSNAAYMPYVEYGSGASGGTTTASASGGSGSSGGGGSSKSAESAAEFTCKRCAAFAGGAFAGVLTEEQTFALNLIRSNIRHAVVNAVCNGENFTVGLKNNSGGASLEVQSGVPVLKLSYSALANVQSSSSRPAAEGSANSHLVPDEVLLSVAQTVRDRMDSLFDFCKGSGCDLLGAERMLYMYHYDDYLNLKGNILPALKVEYDIKIDSVR